MSLTPIEWTDRTWNPTRGCSRVSPGCMHCYAEKIGARFSGEGQPFHLFAKREPQAHWTGKVELIEEKLLEPLSWRKPCRCFVNSMSDLFHEDLPNWEIDKVMAVIALCPHITFQCLTKRADRMERYFSSEADPVFRNCSRLYRRILRQADRIRFVRPGLGSIPISDPIRFPLRNLWLGVSTEDQQRANERIPHLVRTPAAVRFLSVEPMLGPADIAVYLTPGPRRHSNGGYDGREAGTEPVDWVICGGESGADARPFNVEWARHLHDQCKASGVPFFMKQYGRRPYITVAAPSDGHKWNRPIILADKKGGDPSEWPCIFPREFPVSAS